MISALVLALALCAPAAQPPRPRLIVLDVKVEQGVVRPDEWRALLDAIVAETGRFPQVESVSVAELRAALDLESVKQNAGCDDLACASELGNAFGARYVLFSSMNRFGAQWQLSVSFYDSQTTTVVGRGSLRGSTVTDMADLAADVVEEAAVVTGHAPTAPRSSPCRPEPGPCCGHRAGGAHRPRPRGRPLDARASRPARAGVVRVPPCQRRLGLWTESQGGAGLHRDPDHRGRGSRHRRRDPRLRRRRHRRTDRWR